MALHAIVCPISSERIDSNVSRLTVFLNVVLMIIFVITLKPVFIIIVSLDYFIRAALKVQFSPIRAVALWVISLFSFPKKPIDLAPKIFASRLGLICAITATLLFFAGYHIASILVASMLMVLSIMDSVFNFCVGCIIYNYMVFPFYSKRK